MTPTFDLLRDALGAVAGAGLLAGSAWPSYLVARRVLPEARTSARACGAAVVLLWLLAALFWLVTPWGLFRLSVVSIALAILATGTHALLDGRRGWHALKRDLAAAVARTRSLFPGAAGWLLAATSGLALFRALRGTASPPLGWDALTYHLFKAGWWVQHGGLAAQAAPDAWGYYAYYPVVGDLYWAWAMLPFGSDLAITAAGLAFWAMAVLAVYACAVALGADPRRSAMAAAAVGAMPATVAFLSSGYVDNTTLALFLLGALFVVRLIRERRPREAPLAVAALALMLGVKLTTAGLFALGFLMVIALVLSSGSSWRVRRLALLSCLAVAAVGAPGYLKVWVEQGSPFYPFHIDIAGLTLSEGSEAAAEVAPLYLEAPSYRLRGPGDFWMYFLARQKSYGAFVNPGPAVLVFALLAMAALPTLWRDRRRMIAAAFLIGATLIMVAGFLSGSMEVFRTTIKVTTAGRYLTPGLAALAVVAATWPGRIAVYLWSPVVLAGIWLSLPRGWSSAGAEATSWLVGITGLTIVLGLGVWAAVRRERIPPSGATMILALVVVVAIGAVGQVRSAYRYRIWEAAADPVSPAFHMHALGSRYASAWPIWQAMDQRRPYRLAVTAGWDRVGHNWYRYPLLGSRLQNRVLYVPITESGEIIDYRLQDEVASRADFTAWVTRLMQARIDYVVSLAPRWTVEDYWMRNTPELFEKVIADPRNLHAVFRLRRDAVPRPDDLRDPPPDLDPSPRHGPPFP